MKGSIVVHLNDSVENNVHIHINPNLHLCATHFQKDKKINVKNLKSHICLKMHLFFSQRGPQTWSQPMGLINLSSSDAVEQATNRG